MIFGDGSQSRDFVYVGDVVDAFVRAADAGDGELMNVGSLSNRLLNFCNAIVGRMRGGLGHVNVVQSVVFAGMSGSAIADAAGVGRLIRIETYNTTTTCFV